MLGFSEVEVWCVVKVKVEWNEECVEMEMEMRWLESARQMMNGESKEEKRQTGNTSPNSLCLMGGDIPHITRAQTGQQTKETPHNLLRCTTDNGAMDNGHPLRKGSLFFCVFNVHPIRRAAKILCNQMHPKLVLLSQFMSTQGLTGAGAYSFGFAFRNRCMLLLHWRTSNVCILG